MKACFSKYLAENERKIANHLSSPPRQRGSRAGAPISVPLGSRFRGNDGWYVDVDGNFRSGSKVVAALAFAAVLALGQYSISLAQPKSGPTGVLNDQKTELTLQFPSAPSTKIALNASDVEGMIGMLAQLRARMNPPRPMVNPSPGVTVINVATAGRWWTQPNGAGIDLDVLHPGYGWVGILMDRDSTELLIRTLSRSLHPVAAKAKHIPRKG